MNDSVNNADKTERKVDRNPYTPWFVVFAFVAPVLLAYAFYFLGVTPPSFNNNGELLNPVVDIESLALASESGEIITREDITQHKWQLVYFAGKQCDEACKKVLLNIRQINKAVGKNAYRLRRLIVHLEQADDDFLALIKNEYPDALHASASKEAVLTAMASASPSLASHDVYLVDPLGNIMMRFKPELAFKDVLHDLNTLFKVSQIG